MQTNTDELSNIKNELIEMKYVTKNMPTNTDEMSEVKTELNEMKYVNKNMQLQV